MSDNALIRTILAMAVIALLVLAAGCGGSDDGSGEGPAGGTPSAESQAAGGEAGDAAAASPEQRAIRRTFDELQRRFYAGDGEGTCRLMAPLARRQAANMGSEPTSCPVSMRQLGQRSADQSERAPNFVSAEVRGDTATVVAKKPDSDVPAQEIPYVKQGDVWRMARLRPGN